MGPARSSAIDWIEDLVYGAWALKVDEAIRELDFAALSGLHRAIRG